MKLFKSSRYLSKLSENKSDESSVTSYYNFTLLAMLLKLKIGEKLFMIDKDVLISKSAYFEALLDGPLSSHQEADGAIVITEKDYETFQQLLFVIKNDKFSLLVLDDALMFKELETMASFYLVTLPNPTIQKTIKLPRKVYTFRNYVSGTPSQVADELEKFALRVEKGNACVVASELSTFLFEFAREIHPIFYIRQSPMNTKSTLSIATDTPIETIRKKFPDFDNQFKGEK